MVAHRVLAQARLEAGLGERQGRGVRHVGVDHAGGVGSSVVQAGVEPEGGQLGVALALDVAVAVDDEQVARPQLGPVRAVRVEEEPVGSPGHGQADVVVDALVEPVQHRSPQDRDEVEPGVALAARRQATGRRVAPAGASDRRCSATASCCRSGGHPAGSKVAWVAMPVIERDQDPRLGRCVEVLPEPPATVGPQQQLHLVDEATASFALVGHELAIADGVAPERRPHRPRPPTLVVQRQGRLDHGLQAVLATGDGRRARWPVRRARWPKVKRSSSRLSAK